MLALERVGAAPCCVQGVNPSWFKQELGEEAPLEHRPALAQGGPDVAAGSCLGGTGDKRCPTSLYMGQLMGDHGGANELGLPGLSVTVAKAFGCQGYFGKVSAGKPACSWVQCPVFAKLGQSSPLSSEARVAAVILVPSAWWQGHLPIGYCLCILSSWLLPGSHLSCGLQPHLLLLVQAPWGCFSTSSLLWVFAVGQGAASTHPSPTHQPQSFSPILAE